LAIDSWALNAEFEVGFMYRPVILAINGVTIAVEGGAVIVMVATWIKAPLPTVEVQVDPYELLPT
jgi:hypothetical protein